MTMDSATLKYFSSINPLTKRVVGDVMLVEELLADRWSAMNLKEKDSALDDFFVKPDIRRVYQDADRPERYPESFPRLTISSGEKIIIDENNDFWTWQDEHSAPFSWRSKSQEDLTLADLEPEELAKPSSKASKSKKQESCSSAKPPETQFLYKSESLWNDTFPEKLKEMNSVKHSEVILTQNKTDDSTDRRSQSPEAINYAFKGSNGDLRKPATDKQPNGIHHNSPKRTPSIKSETKNTKLSLSSSFSRKKQQDGEPLVNSTRKDSLSKSKSSSREFNQVELNAFDNPAMAGTVGLLSQEEESSSSSNSSPAHKPLLKEPVRQTMEREGVVFHQPSFEGEDGYRTAELQPLESSQSEALNDSSIPMTGFDFLDSW